MSEGYKTLSGRFSNVLGSYNVPGKFQVADAETGIILVSTEMSDVGIDLVNGELLKKVMDSKDDCAVEIKNNPLDAKTYLILSHIVLGPMNKDSDKKKPLAVSKPLCGHGVCSQAAPLFGS